MTQSTVLITGANRGIGLEFTRVFAGQKWRVLACCRNRAEATELDALSDQFSNIEIHTLDVTDYDGMAQLSAQLSSQTIDLLLCNAGVYGPRIGFGEVAAQDWRDVLEVNTIAPLMLAQHFVDQVAASERRVMAFISSKMGSIADNSSGGSYIYRSSKTALNQVTQSLSHDLADRGISVVTLHPGWVQTDMGGSHALVTVEQSVAGMMKTLQEAEQRSGEFIDLDGSVIPW